MTQQEACLKCAENLKDYVAYFEALAAGEARNAALSRISEVTTPHGEFRPLDAELVCKALWSQEADETEEEEDWNEYGPA